ncbi:MAG: HK97 family phage prohead protease [Terrimicrobiaceae bacterium]
MPEVEREIRTFTFHELRVVDGTADQPTLIEGYAAVFNALSEDLGGFREMIHPGAFAKTIKEADVRALINHDPAMVIGRTKNHTLTMKEDIHGLRVAITPPDTSYARDLVASLRRGDIDQMSFGFETVRDEWHITNDEVMRALVEVRLFDVSPVTFPAYPQTTVQVRSKATEMQRSHAIAPGQAAHPMGAEQAIEQALDIMLRQIEIAERE